MPTTRYKILARARNSRSDPHASPLHGDLTFLSAKTMFKCRPRAHTRRARLFLATAASRKSRSLSLIPAITPSRHRPMRRDASPKSRRKKVWTSSFLLSLSILETEVTRFIKWRKNMHSLQWIGFVLYLHIDLLTFLCRTWFLKNKWTFSKSNNLQNRELAEHETLSASFTVWGSQEAKSQENNCCLFNECHQRSSSRLVCQNEKYFRDFAIDFQNVIGSARMRKMWKWVTASRWTYCKILSSLRIILYDVEEILEVSKTYVNYLRQICLNFFEIFLNVQVAFWKDPMKDHLISVTRIA